MPRVRNPIETIVLHVMALASFQSRNRCPLIIPHPHKSDELKIRVKDEKHSLSVRDKLDILSTTNVPWLVGLLGGDIVPLSLRPDTISHTMIRLEKMDVKSLHEIGDHIVIVHMSESRTDGNSSHTIAMTTMKICLTITASKAISRVKMV